MNKETVEMLERNGYNVLDGYVSNRFDFDAHESVLMCDYVESVNNAKLDGADFSGLKFCNVVFPKLGYKEAKSLLNGCTFGDSTDEFEDTVISLVINWKTYTKETLKQHVKELAVEEINKNRRTQ